MTDTFEKDAKSGLEHTRVLHNRIAPPVPPSTAFRRPPIPNEIKVIGGRERLAKISLHSGAEKLCNEASLAADCPGSPLPWQKLGFPRLLIP